MLTICLLFYIYLPQCMNSHTNVSIQDNFLAKNIYYKYFTRNTVIISSYHDIPDFFMHINQTRMIINHRTVFNEKIFYPETDYILLENNLTTLEKDMQLFNNTLEWYYDTKFFILFEKLEEKDVRTAFRKLWYSYIYYVVIISENNFYTWNPYSKKKKCWKEYDISKNNVKHIFRKRDSRKLYRCNFTISMSAAIMYIDKTLKHGYLAPCLETIGDKLGVTMNIHIGDYLKEFLKTGEFRSVGQAISGNKFDAIFYGGLNEARVKECHCDYSSVIYFTYHVLLLPPRPRLGSTFQIFDIYCIVLLATSLASLIIIWKYYYDISYTQSMDDIFSLLQCSKINTKNYGQVRNNVILGLLIICFTEIAIFYQTGLTTEITKPKLSPKPKYLEDITDTNLTILNGYHTADHLLLGRSQYVRDHFKRHSLEVDIPIDGKLKYFVNSPNVVANVDSLWLKLIKNPDQVDILYNDPVFFVRNRIVMKKHHPLLPELNVLISRILEAGLTNKWVLDAALSLEKYEVKVENREHKSISFKDLNFCFKVLFLGHAIALVVFFIEFFLYRCKIN